ncbi:hypothetical protein EU383_20850 [Salmonella enterica subsp. enterica serovar Napoli]|uniref:Cyanophage baseplate Pam3 plug gp18 domain-containing protein n=1 Tax=Salmonella enterica subsp. enterica serovar Napoli TaxID=1151001 RepID=A0A5I4KB88_SALET|nr:hypothetical protein [Salmonella enterica subsp. enterica serovar Napoli]EAW0369175.1 hypothetical protein [Salmonella enterica]EBN0192339.1 hypothetical protein [Salmonella enterica subsp. enterica serovar Enteritidis]EDS6569749.1 hypothetical protein [Salmonella enterica subsp. enterica]EAX5132976.1 hypothetical protein [Salmonella enterica]
MRPTNESNCSTQDPFRVNLLQQYPQSGIDGELVVITDKGAPEDPTKDNLGIYSHLIFVQV